MEENKLDRRRQQSVRAIRDTFLNMLRKQALEDISVKELCQKADVNRSTFYRNYADVYALWDSLVEECFDELFRQPVASAESSGDNGETEYRYILNICETTQKKKDLYRLLLFGRVNQSLLQKLSEAMYKLYFNAHEASSYHSSEEISLYYHFLASGMIGMWIQWVKDDCRLPKEDVARAAQNMIIAFFEKMDDLYATTERRARPASERRRRK